MVDGCTCLAQALNELQALHVREALKLFSKAENQGANPDLCAAGRWHCHMLLGEFEPAWQQSDGISGRGNPDPNRFWDGRPLDHKRVLIRCLHGLGDTIQFIRYALSLRKFAASVTIEAQPKLKSLIAESGLADDVITWTDPEPPWDSQIEVTELPRIFRSTVDTIPRSVPYIHVARTIALPTEGGAWKVGVVWCSSAFNPARSVPIEELAAIFDIPDISFYALQCGPEHEQITPWRSKVYDLHSRLITAQDTAGILRNLDLLITVDTMATHLAGALAVPVWTLLPYECDWRWMLDRDDSPWYPTMRLFRQPAPGNWNAVVSSVKQALEELVSEQQRVSERAPVTISHRLQER
jgi:hypothetical protein